MYENICRFADGAVVALAASRDYLTGEAFAGVAEHDRQAGYPIYRIPLLRPANIARRPGLIFALCSVLDDIVLMLRLLSARGPDRSPRECPGDLPGRPGLWRLAGVPTQIFVPLQGHILRAWRRGHGSVWGRAVQPLARALPGACRRHYCSQPFYPRSIGAIDAGGCREGHAC